MSDFRNTTTEIDEVVYPESDGKPIADNTRQFRIIVMLEGGLESYFLKDPNVFVAGDLLWYPIKGDVKTRAAPDAMVAFGRPKGDRGCYVQHREGGIAPQIVFEVTSQWSTKQEMAGKLEFNDRFGVEEYYVHDPDRQTLVGYLRKKKGRLRPIDRMRNWISPRTDLRITLENGELAIHKPKGGRFLTYLEAHALLHNPETADQLIDRRLRELAVRNREAKRRMKLEQRRVERLENELRRLGVDPDRI